jgi:deoxycytidine triphosphate deaminase
MILSSEKILERDLLQTNGKGEAQQCGYDLTLCRVTQIQGNSFIGKDKSFIPEYIEIETDIYVFPDGSKREGWHLLPGIYSLTYEQGCKLDASHNATVKNRSSMQRSGTLIESGKFDPGFSCDKTGSTMFVFLPITIEFGARISQFVVSENYPTENLYNGQYQGEKDRK